MRKLILLASAAAMAAAMPALAQGRGNSHGKGGGHQAEARGGGHQDQARGGGGRADNRGARNDDRGQGRGNRRDGEVRVDRSQGREIREARGRDDRGRGVERRELRQQHGHGPRREARREDRDWGQWMGRRNSHRSADRFVYWRDGRPLPVSVGRGGCPPGLAKQNAFCMPPGQLRHARSIGQRIDRSRFGRVPDDYLYRFRDEDDFYYLYDNDGYIYQVARQGDLVSSIIPLFATDLLVGQALPIGFDVYNLPVPYREYYADDDYYLYRYDDGAIYRVNNETRLIESVVALLSGNPISVGSPLPAGYDVYNVPFDYRDRYADSDESMYRYSDGAIYEVDPTTMLVQALVEMIV